MNTIFDEVTRTDLIRRISEISEDHKPSWGEMNVYQMLRHNTYWNSWILGTEGHTYKQEFLGKIFGKIALRRMISSDKHLDKNIPTSEQFKVSDVEGDLDLEKERWMTLIEEYASYHNPEFVHDFFGKMSKDQIGILVYKHTDHHLRQFEV